MTMSISMTINDDEIGLEQNEVFPLAFSESDSRVIVGGRGLFSSTDITIEDDDGLIFHCSLFYVCLYGCLLVCLSLIFQQIALHVFFKSMCLLRYICTPTCVLAGSCGNRLHLNNLLRYVCLSK